MIEPGVIFAGDYRVVRTLATGGMGAVLVVEQLSTHKLRALKIMQPHLLSDVELRKRFVQEANIGARIESEHVVEVHGAGIDAPTGYPYLVMELLEGEDLAHRLESKGALTVAELLPIFAQLTHALGAAHAAGVVHRDLKPENIFLARSKRADVAFTVKILDFGIAKLVAEGTAATGAMGSPLWLAPEQTEAGSITPAADVWSLGLIAFHALTNGYFWSSTDGVPTVSQLLREIVLSPIPRASDRASALGRSLPRGFDEWFSRCVARDPRARFATAVDAFDAMKRAFSKEEAFADTAPGLAAGAFSAPPFSAAKPIGSSPPAVLSYQPPSARSAPPPGATPPPVSRTQSPEKTSSNAPIVAAFLIVPILLLVVASGVAWKLGLLKKPIAAASEATPSIATQAATGPAIAPVTPVALAPSSSGAPAVSVTASNATAGAATPAAATTTSTAAIATASKITSASPHGSSLSSSHAAPVASVASVAPAPSHKPALEPEGTLPDGVVERILRDHVSQTRACYTDAIHRDPTLHGKIIVRYWITADGSVRKVVDNGSTINDDEMRACVFRVLYSLHYPKPEGGDVIVDLPLSYEQKFTPKPADPGAAP